MNKDIITVPFAYLSPTIPLLTLPISVIGSEPAQFILDTGNGAFGVAVSPEYAESLGLTCAPMTTREDGFTVDLSADYSTASVDQLRLGDQEMGPMEVGVLPALGELNSRLNSSIAGNLGYEFLKRYSLTFDFVNSSISFDPSPSAGEGVEFDLDPEKPLILIDVESGGHSLCFALDTGASMCCLSLPSAEMIGLELGESSSLNRSATANCFTSKLPSLKVAGVERTDVSVAVADFVVELSAKVGRRIDGVLGHNFWSHYRMTLDYPRQRLSFAEPQ